MSDPVREVVIAALHRAVGYLNDADIARLAHSGQDVAMDRIEMDSLSLFEVIMEIEDALGLELDAEDVAAQPSLDALVAFLKRP